MSQPNPKLIFDNLADVVDAHFPKVQKTMREARLFLMPGPAHEFLPKTITEDERQFLMDEFFLPFDTIAVEDPAGCVILQDTTEKQKGIATMRRFIDAIDVHADQKAFGPGRTGTPTPQHFELMKRMLPPGALMITFGQIKDIVVQPAGKTGYDARVTTNYFALANKDRVYYDSLTAGQEASVAIGDSAGRNALTALEEVMWFNAPGRFVLEAVPEGYERAIKKGVTKKKIIRSDFRPRYTLLTPQEIRKVMKLPPSEPTGRKQSPHERRRHKRYLRAERYTHKRFQWVDVDAAWIGPEEAKVGNMRYKVRLDL